LNKNKKYQTGGSIANAGALRDLNLQLLTQDTLDKWESAEGKLGLVRGMGETQAKIDEEIRLAQERIRKQQEKSKGLFKKLKVLDFIPGGKWLKVAIKAGAGFDQAKNMKNLLGKLNISGFEGSFAQKSQQSFNDMLNEQRRDISPLKSAFSAVVGDIIGNKMGQTFGEAFNNQNAAFAQDSVADSTFGPMLPGQSNINLSAPSPLLGKSTPWADQFKSTLGIGDDFNLKGGTGMNFLDMLGFGESGNLWDASNAGKSYNAYGGGNFNINDLFR